MLIFCHMLFRIFLSKKIIDTDVSCTCPSSVIFIYHFRSKCKKKKNFFLNVTINLVYITTMYVFIFYNIFYHLYTIHCIVSCFKFYISNTLLYTHFYNLLLHSVLYFQDLYIKARHVSFYIFDYFFCLSRLLRFVIQI